MPTINPDVRRERRPTVDPNEELNQWQYAWRAGIAKNKRDMIRKALESAGRGYRVGDAVLATGREWIQTARELYRKNA